eukprot:TRINITY_DN3943_c0_g1_i1.p1 TRINITY_DN3943_c0_g1~~TRINITY_DN3943_c0_g1_i1.p1  ORF type:complete len:445 (-),score=85.20 TRINITY_DN3943_c0_g1_i1:153-1487(-)
MLTNFSQLLDGSGLSSAQFFESHWEKAPLHIRRNNPDFYSQILTLTNFDSILDLALESPNWVGDVLIFKDFKQIKCSRLDIHAAYLDGASVVINHSDKLWEPLNRICRGLRPEFNHVFTNLYLTPPYSQAVPRHTDDRDTLIMQVAGRKMWKIYGAPLPLPFVDEMLGKGGPKWKSDLMRDGEVGEPMTIWLETGDMLYVPRGLVHEALTGQNECSLHATFAIPTQDFTWGGVILDLIKEKIRTHNYHPNPGAPMAASDWGRGRGELVYREAVPVGFADPSVSNEQWAARYKSLVHDLVASSENDLEAARQTFRAKIDKHNKDQSMSLPEAAQVKETFAANAAGLAFAKVSSISSRVKTNAAGREVTEMTVRASEGREGKERVSTRCVGTDVQASIHFIADDSSSAAANGKPFSFAELPARDDFERLSLIKLLANVHVLKVIRT